MKRLTASPRWRVWGRRLLRVLLLLVVLGVALLVGLGVVIVRYGAQDHAAPADLIIVLGGGPEGTTRRTEHGIALYQAGYAPALLCTGSFTVPGRTAEAQRCAADALAAGLPPDAVLIELDSRSTQENAIAAKRIMDGQGWETALLVSDDYHLWRAHWIFEQHGLHALTSPAQATTGSLGAADEARSVAREVLAVSWNALKSLFDLPYTDAPF